MGTKGGLEGCQSELTFRPGCGPLPQPYLHTLVFPHKDFALFIRGMDLNISLEEGGFAHTTFS